MKDIKCISFENPTLDDKVRALYLSNVNNRKVRFETLHNTNIFDEVTHEGDANSIREIILSIKHNNAPLFADVK